MMYLMLCKFFTEIIYLSREVCEADTIVAYHGRENCSTWRSHKHLGSFGLQVAETHPEV